MCEMCAGVSAKEAARRLLNKNPNQYFYRHNEPGEEQWSGNWTQEVRIKDMHLIILQISVLLDYILVMLRARPQQSMLCAPAVKTPAIRDTGGTLQSYIPSSLSRCPNGSCPLNSSKMVCNCPS